MLKDKKKIIVIAVVVVAVLAVGILFISGKKKATVKPAVQSAQPLDDNALVPTVDPSVQVALTPTSGKKEVVLKLTGIPGGTTSVDYELSYQEKTKGLQGVIGTIPLSGEKTFEKKITLGTCSSGKCVYHEVVGAVKVTLKFLINGEERLFEKEYDI